jgi:hypothetical protein
VFEKSLLNKMGEPAFVAKNTGFGKQDAGTASCSLNLLIFATEQL